MATKMEFYHIPPDADNKEMMKKWVRENPNFIGIVDIVKKNRFDNKIYYAYEVDKGKFRKQSYKERNWITVL